MDFLQKVLDTNYRFPSPHSSDVKALPFGEYYDVMVNAKTPFTVAFLYYVIVSVWKSYLPKKPVKKPMSFGFKMFVLLHNVALFLFSLVTFVAVAPRIGMFFGSRALIDAICDKDGLAWEQGIGYWTWIFYLSKYYEIIDTLILLLKGRRPSLLQSFHHAGAIVSMWFGASFEARSLWLFTCFNSFIHTLMYFYYALTTVGISPPGKQYLTSLQITQFVVGGSIGLLNALVPGCATNKPGWESFERIGTAFVLTYLVVLTFLFADFAKTTYGKPSEKVVESAAAAKKRKTKKSD